MVLFSRLTFTKIRVDDFSLTRNVTVPVFKGRPKSNKKMQKEIRLLEKKKQKKLLKEVCPSIYDLNECNR